MSGVVNRKQKKEYSAVSNEEPADLTPKEKAQLKREARKLKWVRRLNKINDIAHAICKTDSVNLSSLGLTCSIRDLSNELLPPGLGKSKSESVLLESVLDVLCPNVDFAGMDVANRTNNS